MQTYVVGFIFSPDHAHIVLVLKNRPVWQAGRFNGVGGKIEAGETAAAAMARECFEETGLSLGADQWQHKAQITDSETYRVDCFMTISPDIFSARRQERESEEIRILSVGDITTDVHPVIDNLKWLIPLCLDDRVSGVACIEKKSAIAA